MLFNDSENPIRGWARNSIWAKHRASNCSDTHRPFDRNLCRQVSQAIDLALTSESSRLDIASTLSKSHTFVLCWLCPTDTHPLWPVPTLLPWSQPCVFNPNEHPTCLWQYNQLILLTYATWLTVYLPTFLSRYVQCMTGARPPELARLTVCHYRAAPPPQFAHYVIPKPMLCSLCLLTLEGRVTVSMDAKSSMHSCK
jgi:hypothetical protein